MNDLSVGELPIFNLELSKAIRIDSAFTPNNVISRFFWIISINFYFVIVLLTILAIFLNLRNRS